MEENPSLQVNPLYGIVPLPPGQLFFCVVSCVSLYQPDSLVQRIISVQIPEDFPVADSLQGRQVPVLFQTPHFLYKSFVDHLQDATVYPVIDDVPWPCQTDFFYLEVPFPRFCKFEFGERPS